MIGERIGYSASYTQAFSGLGAALNMVVRVVSAPLSAGEHPRFKVFPAPGTDTVVERMLNSGTRTVGCALASAMLFIAEFLLVRSPTRRSAHVSHERIDVTA
jgi:hypothetical protein